MPPPRLLDKKLVNASLATERKQEIDKGKKLVASIEALQEAKSKEEEELQEFREHALKSIQIDIDRMSSENERIKAENRTLKSERIRLEAPLDLNEAWNEVHELKSRNEAIADNILSREIEVIKRENDVRENIDTLVQRERESEKIEIAVTDNLRQAEAEREEAHQTNTTAQELLSKIELRQAEQDAHNRDKNGELERRESGLQLREEQNEQDRLDINREKILLADRRATLERGFAELRRRQDNN